MATKSITRDFNITTSEVAKSFLKALEESDKMQEKKQEKPQERTFESNDLKGKEINDFFEVV